MGRLDQAQTRPEPENVSPNPARVRKGFEAVNRPEKARNLRWFKTIRSNVPSKHFVGPQLRKTVSSTESK